MTDAAPLSRRRLLALGGLAAAGAVIGACSGDGDGTGQPVGGSTTARPGPPSTRGPASTAPATTAPSEASVPAADAPLTAAHFAGLTPCLALPELMAGPFPLDRQLVRRDITEGYPGHPLRLGLRAVDADGCTPIPGAALEVWHADASGDYSAYTDRGGGKDEAEGTTFLRGTQVADDDGIAELQTIYPGWYPGRAVHVHLRVHVDDTLVLTTQLFFDDAYTAEVFAAPPYAEFGVPDTTNATDGIAIDPATDGTLLQLAPAPTVLGDGTLALAVVGVVR